jgi:hypothetical protein
MKNINLALMIQVEGIIGTDRLNLLMAGEEVTLNYKMKNDLLTLVLPHITPEDEDVGNIEDLSIDEVESHLSFFCMMLALSSQTGREKVIGGLLMRMMSDEAIQRLQTIAETSSRTDDLLNSLCLGLRVTKKSLSA